MSSNPQAKKATPPWGSWEVLLEEKNYKVKRITVLPGHRLSYQKHSKRKEHWIVVEGEGEVTLNEKIQTLKIGGSLDIPVGSSHRLANKGSTPLIIIEIQTGNYLGEDDIIRIEDDYGRAGTP